MNKEILNIEIQDFINNNLNSEITSLLLKGTSFSSVETKAIIEQIEAKKRCKTKLPTWFNCNTIYYPNKLNIEQTSSEITAKYKSSIIQGKTIIDLTGGFGVDCFYFSKSFKEVTHCEINKDLSDIVSHNFKELQKNNISVITTDGIDYICTSNKQYDWIYIDPSRRHDTKGKVFFLKDCLPHVPKHLDLLFKTSKNILLKSSPLLDITIGLNELEHVKCIHIVAVNNEVKELLWVLEKGYASHVSVKTINIKPSIVEEFTFQLNEANKTEATYSLPQHYLYEPNAAIMKSGAFHLITHKFHISKLHKHSHLYTSKVLIDFPGRCFKIENVLAYSKKLLKKENFTKANISTRNFPETVQQIRKRFKIKEGGHIYLFFTTNKSNSKIVLVCSKLD
ncbi:class I SAM-dependent methyltransferase [Lacinutrix iliipiscaria]|uniref:Class I SAM-dependent methyltransferase n=1 Tax=Lacinutrix iliipiscaria TaxID=1230532 RepID=A0ABW5WPB6_9FLAO